MPSTYTLNNGIELIGTGEQSGTWGDTTNTNFELLDTALDGQVSVTLAATGSSGSPNTLPISDGASSNGRNRLVIFGDGGDLGGTAFVQLTPNDAEKIIYVRNNLSGSRSILLFQGTYNASNDYEVPAGTTAVVFFNGAGSGAVAANVFNNAFFDSLRLGGVSVTAIIDDDSMGTASATNIATSESIKAYVDAQVGANNELSEVLANGNTTGGTDIAVSTGDDITFADSSKAIFGAGSDLQIYHSGSHSVIKDAGDGNLQLIANDFQLRNGADNANMMTGANGGAVTLMHNGSSKLATSSTGIDVTGTVTADDAGFYQSSGTSQLRVGASSAYNWNISRDNDSTGGLQIQSKDAAADVTRAFFSINGDISFYEDTGTTAKFFWDASTERLGIGTASPNTTLDITTASNTNGFLLNVIGTAPNYMFDVRDDDASKFRIDSSGRVGIGTSPSYTLDIASSGAILNMNSTNSNGIGTIYRNSGTAIGYVGSSKYIHSGTIGDFSIGTASTNNLTFGVNSSEKMRIDSSGNVGIGTSSPDSLGSGRTVVDITGSTGGYILTDDGTTQSRMGSEGGVGYLGTRTNHPVVITTNNAEAMRIDSSGNVGIGSATPNAKITLKRSGAGLLANGDDGTVVALIADTTGSVLTYGTYTSHPVTFKTANGERMRIDSSGNVGIGTSSPSYPLHVKSSATTTAVFDAGSDGYDVQLRMEQNGTFVGAVGYDDSLDAVYLNRYGNATQGLTVVSGGNVGIGTSSPSALFQVEATDGTAGGAIKYTSSGVASGYMSADAAGLCLATDTAGITFRTGITGNDPTDTGSERMRIDSSGNLLVGKTDTSIATQGVFFSPNYSHITSTNDTPLALSRKSSDGIILDIRKDGTTVGSIGVASGHLTIGDGDLGLIFNEGSSDRISPWNISTGASRDDAISLGETYGRFKDLYLSGGVYLGGTGSANRLDDYEEGTFTPVVIGQTTGGTGTYSIQKGGYVKVGNFVTFQIQLGWTAHTGTGNFRISGLPFTSGSVSSVAYGGAFIAYNNGLSYTSGSNVGAYVAGGSNILPLTQDDAGTLTAIPMDTACTELIIVGSYITS